MSTQAHVALVRAMLLGEEAKCAALLRQLRRDGQSSQRELEVYLNAVFEQAARRRFGPDASRGDIIRFVSTARTDGALKDDLVDVLMAEKLLTASPRADQEAVRDMDPAEVSGIMGPLLADLLPFPPDERVVDEVLAEAGERAEQAMRNLAG